MVDTQEKTDEQKVAEHLAAGTMPPGAAQVLSHVTQVPGITPPTGASTAPPTEEERKSFLFRVLYKIGRAIATSGRAVKRSWNYFIGHIDQITAFTFMFGVSFTVGFGLTMTYAWLLTIQPMLAYAFLAAIIAQASVTVVAYSSKVFVERRKRLSKKQAAVLV